MTPQELLLAKNYFNVPYDEAAMRTTILFIVGVFFSTLALNRMSMRPKKKSVQLKKVREFTPKAQLSAKDQVLLDMLDPLEHNFCITDPSLPDNPIIYASEAFCKFTEYDYEEIVGRNCRFLQGSGTDKTDIARIRNAVSSHADENVCLLNFKKGGTPFNNQFFLCALREEGKGRNNVLYHLGVQHEVAEIRRGQAPDNVGWCYSIGSRDARRPPPPLSK
jgi:PAS domain-containing protein